MTSFQAKELAPYPGEFVVLRLDAAYSRRIDTHGRFTQTDAELFAESLNIRHESGLTPRQLLAQRDALLRKNTGFEQIVAAAENSQVWPFPPMRKDESTFVDADLAKRINRHCSAMYEEIKHLRAALAKCGGA